MPKTLETLDISPRPGFPDTEIPDTEIPDTENPDTGTPDTENPDTENPDPGTPPQTNTILNNYDFKQLRFKQSSSFFLPPRCGDGKTEGGEKKEKLYSAEFRNPVLSKRAPFTPACRFFGLRYLMYVSAALTHLWAIYAPQNQYWIMKLCRFRTNKNIRKPEAQRPVEIQLSIPFTTLPVKSHEK